MHVVAITKLATPVEAEAPALARDLGSTAYEERLKLVAGLPAIVLTAADPARAAALLAKVRARGHEAFVVDGDAVVASGAMVQIQRFAFDDGGITLTDSGLHLPGDDILAILRAMHASRTESVTEVTTKQFDVGRAVLSGGLIMRKSVTKEQRSTTATSEQVLYLFRRGGGAPWLLRERGAHYGGLGAQLDASSARNFMTTIARVRALAPEAVYNERLIEPGAVSRQIHRVGGGANATSSTANATDLVAHVLALSFAGR